MKHSIQVRDGTGTVLATIKRKVYGQQIGNFFPYFCRWAGKTFLLKSDAGDVSDPFRVEPSYAQSFFIESHKPCQWSL